MPLTFKSQATGDLVMLKAHAQALLTVLGKSNLSQGILEPADMPAALVTLRTLGDRRSGAEPVTQALSPVEDPADEPGFSDEEVSLRKRAWPLAKMIEEALAAGKPIVWGV
jgi:hypothetical protein